MPYNSKEKTNAFFRRRYRDNQEFVQKYKIKSGCVDCGYNKHHAGLEFDHIFPRKRGTVSSLLGRSLKVIKEEIKMCEVVCGTCHGIRTWERGWQKANWRHSES